MTITMSKELKAAQHLSYALNEIEVMEPWLQEMLSFLVRDMKAAIPALRMLHAKIAGTKKPPDGADEVCIKSEN